MKEEFEIEAENTLKAHKVYLDSNTCVINCRGGEYKGVKDLFLPVEYYNNAIDKMKYFNPSMKFIVVTDDPMYFRTVFNLEVVHFSISTDYYMVNHARNLILSNSGFALFPAWLNQNSPKVIAPMYWSRYNISEWASSDIWTFGLHDDWLFIDKEKNTRTSRGLDDYR
jgi:hypothetical protein